MSGTRGRPGEVGRPSVCSSCHSEEVPAGETECAFCRAVDDDPPLGWKKDLREWYDNR